MCRSIFTLFLLLFVFASCDHDPLAQDMPSLRGTSWKHEESVVTEHGTYTTTILLHFRDDNTVIYRSGYKTETPSETTYEESENLFTYLYDFSVKQGVFIFEEYETGSFELRGNLLFLQMGNSESIYIFRRGL